jgi:hypothetical protein
MDKMPDIWGICTPACKRDGSIEWEFDDICCEFAQLHIA